MSDIEIEKLAVSLTKQTNTFALKLLKRMIHIFFLANQHKTRAIE